MEPVLILVVITTISSVIHLFYEIVKKVKKSKCFMKFEN